MFDILPFPNINATDSKEQLGQINNYLIQLKETLEFILTNISVDNLSPELRQHLNGLSSEIKIAKEEQEDVTQRVSQSTLTVSDVINSPLFQASIPTDYIVSGEQTTTSTTDGGENVFTFSNADGTTETFKCRNGNKGAKGDKGDTPTVTLEIDYETGELLYKSS